VPLQGKKDKLG